MDSRIMSENGVGNVVFRQRATNHLDAKCIVGSMMIAMSVILIAVQALNPYSAIGGVFYTILGLGLVNSSKSGPKLKNRVAMSVMQSMSNRICNLFEEDSIGRITVEIVCAYAIYSCGFPICSPMKSLNFAGTVSENKIITTKNSSICKNVLSTIKSELSIIFKDSNRSQTQKITELSRVAKEAVLKECNIQTRKWFSNQYLPVLIHLRYLWEETIRLVYGQICLSLFGSSQLDSIRKTNSVAVCSQIRYCLSIVESLSLARRSDWNCASRYLELVAVSIIITNMVAFRIGVHPSRLAWLRNVITIKLIAKTEQQHRTQKI